MNEWIGMLVDLGKLAISICGGDGGWDCFSAGWFGGTALVVVGGVGCILIHYVNITVKMQLTEKILPQIIAHSCQRYIIQIY